MSNFTLNIQTDNAAFQDDGPSVEVVRILRELADKIERTGADDYSLIDINGNRVGSANFGE